MRPFTWEFIGGIVTSLPGMVCRKVGKILGRLHFEQNKVILEEMAEKAIRQAVHGRNVQEQVIGQH